MLKPDAFGAMTAILDVPAQRRRKPSGHNGLTGDCRHRDPQDGKSGRNRNSWLVASRIPNVGWNGDTARTTAKEVFTTPNEAVDKFRWKDIHHYVAQ